MSRMVYEKILPPDSDAFSEWFWVRRLLPVSFPLWVEIGPSLKQKTRQMIEPDTVIEF